MFYTGEKDRIPFVIKCANCGSRDTYIENLEYGEIEIGCYNCGMFLLFPEFYSETKYMKEMIELSEV